MAETDWTYNWNDPGDPLQSMRPYFPNLRRVMTSSGMDTTVLAHLIAMACKRAAFWPHPASDLTEVHVRYIPDYDNVRFHLWNKEGRCFIAEYTAMELTDYIEGMRRGVTNACLWCGAEFTLDLLEDHEATCG